MKADPEKRISEYMAPPEGVSKTDFFVCVGAAKKLAELQVRYEKVEDELVDHMDKVIDGLEKKLERPQEEMEGLLAEYQEAVLLDALAGCKEYKNKDAMFPVEELTKRVGDLQKTYQNDFDWDEDDVWEALEDTWTNARPCLPRAEREKSSGKKAAKTAKAERKAKTEKTERSASHRGARKGKKHPAGERMVQNIRGVAFAFRWCPPGKFIMGGPRHDWDGANWVEKNDMHAVTLTQGFWMLETEVTQAMWFLVMGSNPSEFQGANNPVERVGWGECQEFCRRLSEMLKMPISLPTEAQWEYACRAGTRTLFYWGNDKGALWQYGNYCERSNTNNFSWQDRSRSDGHDKIAPVRSFRPNAWGLYDMSGNVWEWCQDWFGDYPMGMVVDPKGPVNGFDHVYRGGSWADDAGGCQSARRVKSVDKQDAILGFRVVAVDQSLEE